MPLRAREAAPCTPAATAFSCRWRGTSIGLTKRDLAPNINFFMNVPVTPEGGSNSPTASRRRGKYVEMRAEMDVLVLISNCPQLNNPCNALQPDARSEC